MIPQDYLDALCSRNPCPAESGYDRAYWLYQFREAIRWISDFISQEYDRQVLYLMENDVDSEFYELVPVKRYESFVRINHMREKYPEEFAELVFIKATDAVRILGKKRLYNLAEEKIGKDAIKKFEQVNVGDVEKTMSKGTASELIESRLKIVDWVVREKGD